MTKLEFFKESLQKLVDLKNRNEKYDKNANNILDNDTNRDFPVYIAESFCSEYETLLAKSLSQLWDKPEEIEDNIFYLLYESLGSRTGYGRITDSKTKKEYIIKDVESLCRYLLDYYKILGE